MDETFDTRMDHQVARREKAVKTLQSTFSTAGDSVQSEMKRLTDGSTIEEMIVAHPFIAAGVALGAGVLVSKILTSGSSSPVASSSEPQRVVIELKHGGAASVAAPAAAAPSFNPMEFIMKAAAGYEAVQNVLRSFQRPTPPAPDVEATEAPESVEPESVPL